MRLLALLFVLVSMPALAAGGEVLLAQQTQQKPSGSSGSGSRSSGSSGSQTDQTPRHPGDYCTSHCRANEIPCGRKCISSKDGAKCMEKITTTCAGKP